MLLILTEEDGCEDSRRAGRRLALGAALVLSIGGIVVLVVVTSLNQ
jgi:hypothetical protein